MRIITDILPMLNYNDCDNTPNVVYRCSLSDICVGVGPWRFRKTWFGIKKMVDVKSFYNSRVVKQHVKWIPFMVHKKKINYFMKWSVAGWVPSSRIQLGSVQTSHFTDN